MNPYRCQHFRRLEATFDNRIGGLMERIEATAAEADRLRLSNDLRERRRERRIILQRHVIRCPRCTG